MSDKKKIRINPGNGHDAAAAEPETAPPMAGEADAESGRAAYDGPAGPFAAPRETQADPDAAPAAASVDEPLSDAETLSAERDAYLDSLLRLRAEFDNFRKRSQREVSEVGRRARADVIAEFLPVIDNLDRALNAAEHHDESKVLEGVRLTHSLFAQLLRREGVSEVRPLGEVFDPSLHEAMMATPSEEPEGIVVAVMEPGYVLDGQVLRPAKVAVSSGQTAG